LRFSKGFSAKLIEQLTAQWGEDLTGIANSQGTHRLKEPLTLWRQQQKNLAKHPARAQDPVEESGVGGYVPVLTCFLCCYSRIQPSLTAEQAIFVIHSRDGAGEKVPRLKYGLLATRLGVSNDTIVNIVKELRAKKSSDGTPYLVTEYSRRDKDWTFDFTGLFKTIAAYVHARNEKREALRWDQSTEARQLIADGDLPTLPA